MQTKTAVLIVVCAVASTTLSAAAVMLSASLLGPLPLAITQTTTQKQSTFNVTGTSEVSVVPDNAQVSLGIEATRDKVSDAQNEVNRVMLAVSSELKRMGIDEKDIKTQNYNVYPNYDYRSSERNITGYRASSTLRVTVKEFDKINSIIDTATANGVNNVSGISFLLSDEKEATTKEQARKEAIEKAKENAKELSGLAGMKLGKIINIAEGQESAPRGEMALAKSGFMMADAANSAPTNIEAGSSTYTYSVTLSYETY